MTQEVKNISLKKLVLWTENPRDPISEDSTDQDIADAALSDTSGKWELQKLAKSMGEYYDFSELPTVVYQNGKPIVYDGNRRVLLGKIKHGLVSSEIEIAIPDIPGKIPCNVCSKEVALKNVERKHRGKGSWQPLERDIFLHDFMGEEKSTFLKIDDATGIISQNPHLNQVFVKEEILNEDNLEKLGFSVDNKSLRSKHSDDESLKVLHDISDKVRDKVITTRRNRGKISSVLEPSSQKIIDTNEDNSKPEVLSASTSSTKRPPSTQKHKGSEKEAAMTLGSRKKRVSSRTKKKSSEMFGGKLYLQSGAVSDLYRDISDLYAFYVKNRTTLSQTFPNIIRMALRLLCETAAKETNNTQLNNYLKNNFDLAKKRLEKDDKTTLSTHNVTKDSIVQLLQTGAHVYKSSSNTEQTIAISIIVGAILSNSHGNDSE